jgi:ABC-type sugar transport system ATPase subunit
MERHGGELVSLKNVSVAFNSIPVLQEINLDFFPGEVHTIIGENGAGKSTLMKTIFGIISPTKGEVIFLQKSRSNQSIHQIIQSGISMIHQELMLIPELSVAENIFLGQENKYAGKYPWQGKNMIRAKCQELLNEFDCHFSPTDLIKNLSIANQQLVEILRAVSQQAKLILMDEPTSSLSENEILIFKHIIDKLKKEGVGMIFTSHKMEEIFRFSDKISVLKDGQLISTNLAKDISQNELVTQMVGKDIPNFFPTRVSQISEEILVVKDLQIPIKKISSIHFTLHKGEILGLAGLVGAGRSEIGMAIAGMLGDYRGDISLKGVPIRLSSPKIALANKIGYVGEDRKSSGFIPEFTIQENISLSSLNRLQTFGMIQKQKEKLQSEKAVKKFSIKRLFENTPVYKLSGGNQQKVVIAKVLENDPEIIILDEPTRGIDVQAKHEIYVLINELISAGKAILLISSDLPELIHLSDRVIVVSKGKQTASLEKNELTPEKIIHFAMQ